MSLYIHKQNSNFKNLNKMQKMIFSAVALVAFSFAGMANEIEEKKVEVKPETKKEAKVVLKVNCGTIKQLAYNLAISEGADDCTAEYYSDIVYANCMG